MRITLASTCEVLRAVPAYSKSKVGLLHDVSVRISEYLIAVAVFQEVEGWMMCLHWDCD